MGDRLAAMQVSKRLGKGRTMAGLAGVKGKRGESGQPLVEGFLRFAAFLEERFPSPAGDASRDKKEANCRTAMGEGK